MAVAPHHWYVQPILAFNISIGVGYCFIHSKGNAKTRVWDKAISSCTFFVLSAFIWELVSTTKNDMENRLTSFATLKRNAYKLASERGFFNGNIRTYNMSLDLIERYVTESIIRRTWKFHEDNHVNISDGQETRLIMHNCIYAGMFAAKFPNLSADVLLNRISSPNITKIRGFVEDDLSMHGQELFVVNLVAQGLVQDIYNNNLYLYSNCSTSEKHWEYYKDFACVMFEIGALYYGNR